jgi:hypothetical protein
MSDYLLSVRRVRKQEFSAEPGRTRFLRIPGNRLARPAYAIKEADWVDAVMAEGRTHTNHSTGHDCGDVAVLVHGYNNDAKSIMWRHRRMKTDLEDAGFKGVLVSFDWPSDDRALNYLEDRSDAKITALRLVDDCISLLASAQFRGCEFNVHVIAHSTGAYVVREAFDDADDRPAIAASNWNVSQICFAGADVSSRSLSENDSKSSSLYRHCTRLTNYQNPYDSVLKLSNVKRVGVAPRAGRIGLPIGHADKAVNVNCGTYFAGKDRRKATFIGAFDHSWYFGDKAFARDLAATLNGDVDRYFIAGRQRDERGALHLRP